MKKTMKQAVCFLFLTQIFVIPVRGMSLDEYLSVVQNRNKTYASLQALQGAATFRFEQENIELSPILTGGANYLDDKSLTSNGVGVITHQQVRSYNLGLAKKFSTGTKASVTGSVQAVNAEGTMGVVPFNTESHTGTLGFTLSQSLYKDLFGRGTHLRWERERALQRQEQGTYDLQAKQTLIDAETAFWDLFYLQEELQLRKEGRERAKKIEGWVKNRFQNGIGDRADLLNAQGLVAARELLELAAQDQLLGAKKTVADQMQWARDQEIPKMEAHFEDIRPLSQFVSGKSGRVVRLDSYLAILEAQAKSVGASEALDKVRPDVVLSGQYKTNGYDTSDTGALNRMTDKDHPVTGVGLSFSWILDWETKDAVRNTAKQEALAAQLKKEQKLLESDTAWNEINRRHGELTKQIQVAAQISTIQAQRAAAERDKLAKGRSITSQVITAEQDAAEAALTLTKLRAQQRKLESQGRLFVKLEEGL